MSFYLLTILEITEKEEEMVTSGYTTQSWTDPRFAWDPEDYLGLNKTRIKAEEVWKPNIILYNSDDGEFKSYIQGYFSDLSVVTAKRHHLKLNRHWHTASLF